MTNKQTTPNAQPNNPPAGKSMPNRIVRWGVGVLMVFVLLCLLIIYLLGTDEGTEFFINKIVNETGIQLQYGQGNLRDGLSVHDLDIAIDDDISVQIDNAYIKIGWRAIFNKELHLRDAKIDNIRITDTAIPTGTPFEYPRLELPVSLRLNHADIDNIVYDKAELEPLVFKDIDANNLAWIGTKLDVGDADLTFSYFDGNEDFDIVRLEQTHGSVDFRQHYPIDARTRVRLFNMSDAKVMEDFADIKLKATGSLEHLTGKLTSHYNKAPIKGKIDIYPLADDAPFTAQVTGLKQAVPLPYATDYKLKLHQPTIDIKGTWRQLYFNIDSQLSAKHIPSGHYTGSLVLKTMEDTLTINKLEATTDKGTLVSHAKLNWQKEFWLEAQARSSNYQLDKVLPSEWQEYQGYLPTALNGTLDFKYQHSNAQGKMQIDTQLKQKNAETVEARVIQLSEANRRSDNGSYRITANWQNLYRKIPQVLDVHGVEVVDSNKGSANLFVQGDYLTADIDADINQLSLAPKGDYQLRLTLKNNDIDIPKLNYQGIIGDLSGTATVSLPNTSKANKENKDKDNQPITWSLNAHSNNLYPALYDDSIAIERISGDFSLSDRMYLATDSKDKDNTQRHQLTINKADISVELAESANSKESTAKDKQNNTEQAIQLSNTNADIDIRVRDNQLSDFTIDYQGDINAPQIPIGHYQLQANSIKKRNSSLNPLSALNNVAIKQVSYQGKHGKLNGSGTLQLTNTQEKNKTTNHHANNNNAINNLAWQLQTQLTDFDLSAFHPDTSAIVSGNLDSHGQWRTTQTSNDLQALQVKFDGRLQTDKLATGALILDAQLANKDNKKIIELRQLSHQVQQNKQTSAITATGSLTLPKQASDGYQWQLTTSMDAFNFGYFNNKFPSQLTGGLTTSGLWNNHSQQISIDKLDIQGKFAQHKLKSSGSLMAKLHLPTDMSAFINSFKTSNSKQKQQQIHRIIEQLQVNDLTAHWGDNHITANGNMHTLRAKVAINKLSQLHDELQGELNGHLRILDEQHEPSEKHEPMPNHSLPTIDVNLVAKKIKLADLISLQEGTIQGQVVELGKQDSTLAIHSKNLMIKEEPFESLQIDITGTQAQHELKLALAHEKVAVSANLAGQLATGKTASQKFTNPKLTNHRTTVQTAQRLSEQTQWQGTLSQGIVTTNNIQLKQTQPSQLSLDFNRPLVSLSPHCWQSDNSRGKDKEQQGQLCLTDTLVFSQNKGQIAIDLQALDTALLSLFLPDELNWQATLNGNAHINWKKGVKPNIKVRLYSDNGKVGLKQDESRPLFVPYRRVSLIGLSSKQGLRVRTDIYASGKSKGFAEVTIDPYQKSKPITGQIALNQVKLAIFKPFFPGLRTLRGYGSLNAKLNGTLTKPLVTGKFALDDGEIAILGLPVNLDKINAQAQINGTSANLTGSFYSGEGKGNITGKIDWQQALQGKFAITGNELEVAQPPLFSAKLNPDINLIVKPTDKYVEIKGAVSIPSANIHPPTDDTGIVRKSDDVNVLDRREINNIDEVFAITKPWSINADVGVDLGDEVIFKGFGAELPLAGAIVLKQRGQQTRLRAKGVIQVSRRSNIEAFGQNVDLEYAQIRFNGNVFAPNLSISASKLVENNKVGFKVKGNLLDPKITVFNNTGLTQQQVMNALITGKVDQTEANKVSEKGFRSEITNNLIATGLGFGLDNTRTITNQIGRSVGLQSLTLSASGNSDDTNINITGYITPDLYIRYAFGVFNAQTQLSLRYQLTQKFYIQATSATENFIDLVYSWQF